MIRRTLFTRSPRTLNSPSLRALSPFFSSSRLHGLLLLIDFSFPYPLMCCFFCCKRLKQITHRAYAMSSSRSCFCVLPRTSLRIVCSLHYPIHSNCNLGVVCWLHHVPRLQIRHGGVHACQLASPALCPSRFVSLLPWVSLKFPLDSSLVLLLAPYTQHAMRCSFIVRSLCFLRSCAVLFSMVFCIYLSSPFHVFSLLLRTQSSRSNQSQGWSDISCSCFFVLPQKSLRILCSLHYPNHSKCNLGVVWCLLHISIQRSIVKRVCSSLLISLNSY